jgi:hypothetical protein
VTPLLGFSWGFHISNDKKIALEYITALTAADWKTHLPILRTSYKKWKFTEMLTLVSQVNN